MIFGIVTKSSLFIFNFFQEPGSSLVFVLFEILHSVGIRQISRKEKNTSSEIQYIQRRKNYMNDKYFRNRIEKSPLGSMGLDLLDTQQKLILQEYEIESLRI